MGLGPEGLMDLRGSTWVAGWLVQAGYFADVCLFVNIIDPKYRFTDLQ